MAEAEAPFDPKDETDVPTDSVAVALGRGIMMWNCAEMAVKGLLLAITRGSMGPDDARADALISEMGSRQISEALKTMAHDVLDSSSPATEYVDHVAKLYDRLLPYRNYYVHNIIIAVPGEAGSGFHGLIQSKTAKGKLKLHNELIGIKRLVEFRDNSLTLFQFANGVTFSLYFDMEPRPPLPNMPVLPAFLEKPHRIWRELRNPPRSSGE